MNQMKPYFRVDDRLIHGQVVTQWVKALGTSTIWVISDRAAAQPIEVTLLKSSVPPHMSLQVFRVQDALAQWSRQEEDHLLILTEGLEEVIQLHDGGFPIGEVNIGGMRYRPGRKGLNRAVYMGEPEVQLLQEMEARGIDAFIRIMPTDSKVNAYERTRRKWK